MQTPTELCSAAGPTHTVFQSAYQLQTFEARIEKVRGGGGSLWGCCRQAPRAVPRVIIAPPGIQVIQYTLQGQCIQRGHAGCMQMPRGGSANGAGAAGRHVWQHTSLAPCTTPALAAMLAL